MVNYFLILAVLLYLNQYRKYQEISKCAVMARKALLSDESPDIEVIDTLEICMNKLGVDYGK